jgi:hypothetical protein
MAVDLVPGHVPEAIASDPHRPGSVDRGLLERQVFLSRANQPDLYRPPAGLDPARCWPRPWLTDVVAEVTREMAHPFQRATALRRWVASVPRTFPEGGRATRDGFWGGFATFLCGGTEEEVIRKGSPLAAELSRVLVLLADLAGLSARLVFLYADSPPYRHAVTEVFVAGRWSVFDPVSDRSFAWARHGYAGAWEVRQQPRLVDGLRDHGRLPYVAGRFYRTVAIAAYDPWDTTQRYPWDPLDTATSARLRAGEAS